MKGIFSFINKRKKIIEEYHQTIESQYDEILGLKKERKELTSTIAKLELENEVLKQKVEHLQNIIKMKNQEENLSSIYDEYLYGPVKENKQ